MRKICPVLTMFCLLVLPLEGQVSLVPEYGYKVSNWFPEYPNAGAFDFSDTLFFMHDGDTIHMLGIQSGVELMKYGEPHDYADNFVSFLTLSPDGGTIWTGYTSLGSIDDRIYSIDVESGEWKHRATFPGNWDLVFWNDSILVSGLNSSSWEAPAAVFLLDTTGTDKHRRIIEPGGYSSGMAIDEYQNLYYGTSYAMDPNALYRWDVETLRTVIEDPGEAVLQLLDGEKLTDLPAGAYDCEIDQGGHVLFNMNLDGGIKAVCKWNGISGDGQHIDTLATASGDWDWLGMIKSRGDIGLTGPGNMLVTYSFGQPLAKVTRLNTLGLRDNIVREIIIYPNPIHDILKIRMEGPEVVELGIYSLQGSLLYSENDLVSGAEIDVSKLAAGSYVVRLTHSNGMSSQIFQKF